MKTLTFFYIFFISIFMASCTEVIDININSVHPQLVVEASIGLNQPAKVILTRSLGLDSSIEIPFETNAKVQISDGQGRTEILSEISPGIYFTQTIFGKIGQTYELTVTTNTETVTAISKMPEIVKIDSFTVLNTVYPGGPIAINQPSPFYEVKIKYNDPANSSNYYRFILYVNGVATSRNSVSNDRLTNGTETEAFLIAYDPKIKTGDTISVEMLCIEKPVYEYFNSIGSMGGPNSSTPANPYTNLKGAILGYFSAHTVERVDYVLK